MEPLPFPQPWGESEEVMRERMTQVGTYHDLNQCTRYSERATKYLDNICEQYDGTDEDPNRPQYQATLPDGSNRQTMARIYHVYQDIQANPFPRIPEYNGWHSYLQHEFNHESLAFNEAYHFALIRDEKNNGNIVSFETIAYQLQIDHPYLPHPHFRRAQNFLTDICKLYHFVLQDMQNPTPATSAENFVHIIETTYHAWFKHRANDMAHPNPFRLRRDNYPDRHRYFTPFQQIVPTLKALWHAAQTLPPGDPRAELIEFGIQEIRPFAYMHNEDLATLIANTELSAVGERRNRRFDSQELYHEVPGKTLDNYARDIYWTGSLEWRRKRHIIRSAYKNPHGYAPMPFDFTQHPGTLPPAEGYMANSYRANEMAKTHPVMRHWRPHHNISPEEYLERYKDHPHDDETIDLIRR